MVLLIAMMETKPLTGERATGTAALGELLKEQRRRHRSGSPTAAAASLSLIANLIDRGLAAFGNDEEVIHRRLSAARDALQKVHAQYELAISAPEAKA